LLLPFLFFCVTHYFSTGSFCGQLFWYNLKVLHFHVHSL
jgi:hypothetical protein